MSGSVSARSPCGGSIAELKEMSPNCPDDIELHRPYVDAVTITCPVCGKQMKRVPEVIDCWFDSGSMPFAQHHYPFENKELFEKQFPADFISEAVDQTRGWFYSLMAISTLLFNKAPFRNVIVLGHVQDENGQKMSKSKGQRSRPVRGAGDLRRRCNPLVFLQQLRAVAAESVPREGRFGGAAEVPLPHCGIPMPSLCSMPISMNSMPRSIHWRAKS